MPAGDPTAYLGLFGGGGKSTQDLESIQKLINHANDVAENDLKQVTKGAAEVTKIRSQLDRNLSSIRSKLKPACNAYSRARIDLLVGDPESNKKAVSQECLKAQGLLYTMLNIGQKAEGCYDTCAWKTELGAGKCDTSGCHGKLRTKKEMEDIIGGPEWRNHHQEMLEACGKWPYELKILPPSGMEPEEEVVQEAALGSLSFLTAPPSIRKDAKAAQSRQAAIRLESGYAQQKAWLQMAGFKKVTDVRGDSLEKSFQSPLRLYKHDERRSKRGAGGLHRMVWNTMLKAHANAGDMTGARHLFLSMERHTVKPNRQTYGKLMEAAAKGGDVHQAESWFSEMVNELYVGPQRIATHYAILLDACAKVGDIQRGEHWLEKMRSMEVMPSVLCYTSLVNSCAVAGNPSRAEYWFGQMTGASVSPNVITYNAVLDSFAKVGDVEGAVRWQKLIQDANLQPTELTYASLISSAARNRDRAGAVAHLEEMLASGQQPSLVCFNTVIHACSRHGEEAKKWLQKLRECKFQPDEVTFTSLIDGCAKRSKPKQAAEWLRIMVAEELAPSVECYTAVIDSCASRGDIDQAADWIEDMYDRKIHPDTKAYNCVINAAAKASSSNEAVLWLDRMKASSVQPNKVTYTAVIDACVKEGQLAMASSYFQRMVDEGATPDMVAFTTLISGCVRKGEMAKAAQHLEMAKSFGLVPDATCYNAFLAGCAQRGDLGEAVSILEKMKEGGVRPNLVSYNTMLKACRKAGDVAAALQWLQEIDDNSLQPDMISWNCAIGACAAASPRASTKAEQLFRQFAESGLKPDGILLRTLTAAVGPERRRLLCEEFEEQWTQATDQK
ncbi:unnamed protein product [Cladocopium goreaui]|uniref:Pentacotripeptide-repeat region of PRORP domain-containing protein n=1 Tax=Cladocopium goreaui TaxID=2562237 RepID=A0A9P1M5B9_9DINO|nr:unnamed protein product [Cladocopium goreaui]